MDTSAYLAAIALIGIILIIYMIPVSIPDEHKIYLSLWDKLALKRYEIISEKSGISYGTFAKNPDDDATFILFRQYKDLDEFIDDPLDPEEYNKNIGQITGSLSGETDSSFSIHSYVISGETVETMTLFVKKMIDSGITARLFIGKKLTNYFMLSKLLEL